MKKYRGGKTVKLKILPIGDLKEHPKNRELFSDIKSTSEGFWEEFKENIRNLGIIEALVVNENTMEVISGNQRLKAAREIGLDMVPCVLCKPEDPREEIQKMISSNVMRREFDPITLFEYIRILRQGYDGIGGSSPGLDPESIQGIGQKIGKDTRFISAADIYGALSEEQQEELREWFYSQDERPTDGELIKKVSEMEDSALLNGKTIDQLKTDLEGKRISLKNAHDLFEKSEKENAEAKRTLRREIEKLKKAVSKDRNLEAFEKDFKETLKALTKATSQIAVLRLSSEKIGAAVEIRGLAKAELLQSMSDLMAAIKQVKPMVSMRLTEKRKLK